MRGKGVEPLTYRHLIFRGLREFLQGDQTEQLDGGRGGEGEVGEEKVEGGGGEQRH